MAIMARDWTKVSATHRMQSSREVTKAAVGRELMLVSILSRFLPAHLCEPLKPQPILKRLVCLHTAAGPLVWRVSDEEMPLFAHLELSANDAPEMGSTDKLAALLTMATEGWE